MTTHSASLEAERPTIAFAMGDPAGISPELAAKLLAEDDFRTRPGSWSSATAGSSTAEPRSRMSASIWTWSPPRTRSRRDPTARCWSTSAISVADEVTPATATLEGGRFATENFRRALLLAQSGAADAVFFTPFNKKAMRLAYDGYDDEIRFVRDVLKISGPASEFNVLGDLWNARVTSHIPLSAVASAIARRPSSAASR